jgi:hypothetical protein
MGAQARASLPRVGSHAPRGRQGTRAEDGDGRLDLDPCPRPIGVNVSRYNSHNHSERSRDVPEGSKNPILFALGLGENVRRKLRTLGGKAAVSSFHAGCSARFPNHCEAVAALRVRESE